MRFDNLYGKEKTIIRGCFAELLNKKMIKVEWADNYPFYLVSQPCNRTEHKAIKLAA